MPPEIETDRLIPRPATDANAGALFDLVTTSLPELQPWLPWAENCGPDIVVAWCRVSVVRPDRHPIAQDIK